MTHTNLAQLDPVEILNTYGWNYCRIAYQWLNGCIRRDKHGIFEAMELNRFSELQIKIMAEAYDAMTI
jgi:hypothetical protein